MKKWIILGVLLFIFSNIEAEQYTFRTGENFATSLTDFFFPIDINVTGSKCSITSIKNIDEDIWCFSIAVWKSGVSSIPVIYDYYVKPGDTIKFRRISDPMSECTFSIISIKWNETIVDIN